MDSDRNQPFVNNNYPNLQNNNVYVQPQIVPPQNNQGWNQNQPIPNQGWNQNQPNQGWNPNQPNQPIQPNQGYNPNQQNQGFNPNNGQQPFIPGQQPMPNVNNDKIIIIREHSSIPCRMCGYDGMSTWRQSAGCAAFSWCVCLFCFTGIFGFWIPFCIDSCYDTQVLCSRCGQIKASIPADCC